MELKELVKKVTLKDLKTEAKKYSIPAACRTKMNLAKDLPEESFEKLAGK